MCPIKVINRSEIRNGWKGTLTLLSVFYFLLWSDLKLWFETQLQPHHNAARIETIAKWSTQTAALSSLKSLRFSPSPLKSDTHTHTIRTQVCPHCAEPLQSESLGAMCGFGWLVSTLEGSWCNFGTKREVRTWYPYSVTQAATSFTHSVVVSSLPLWLHQPVQTFSVPLLHPKCDPLPWRDIFVNSGQYSVMDTDWVL